MSDPTMFKDFCKELLPILIVMCTVICTFVITTGWIIKVLNLYNCM